MEIPLGQNDHGFLLHEIKEWEMMVELLTEINEYVAGENEMG